MQRPWNSSFQISTADYRNAVNVDNKVRSLGILTYNRNSSAMAKSFCAMSEKLRMNTVLGASPASSTTVALYMSRR